MIELADFVGHTDALLECGRFQDYCPNGLQIEGADKVRKLVTGVTASQSLIDSAVAAGADAILVHHGLFWRGESAVIAGIKRRRIKALLDHNISLIAYHLPLDAHRDYGNNAQLARVLGFTVSGTFGTPGGPAIAMHGALDQPLTADALAARLSERLQRQPLHISGGPRAIRRIAWCTGAAQNYFDAAIALGVDAFITGEASEQNFHSAGENGVHFFAAGHHATERYGVQALGDYLADRFGIDVFFIDAVNPI